MIKCNNELKSKQTHKYKTRGEGGGGQTFYMKQTLHAQLQYLYLWRKNVPMKYTLKQKS